MKNVSMITMSALAALALSVTGCSEDSTTTTVAPNCDGTVINEVLSSSITTNKTLTSGMTYGLDGKVVVESGATLTIEPGTTIAGCTASSFMLIAPGAKIDANGTQAAPIVFTSQKDVLGNSSAGAQSEWGGLAILGNAPIMGGGTKTYEASTESFGGSTSADNSGVLNYVAIKHSGYEVEVDKELNGLSLGGVGSGTSISNIAIIGGADDGIEIWGGTVNITGLYVYNAADDSIDTDLGYNGTITNSAVKQLTTDKSDYNSAGMEFGNDTDAYTVNDTNATYPKMVNAYIEVLAGGLYMKNDAGASFDNVKVIKTSGDNNTTANALVTHRTDDVNATDAITIAGAVDFENNSTTTNLFATENPKGGADTADVYWSGALYNVTTGTFTTNGAGTLSGIATGDLSSIWKGNAGDNNLPAGE